MSAPLRPRRIPSPPAWQRLPAGPLVAPRRRVQAVPRRSRAPWRLPAAGAACGLLVMTVRWSAAW